MNAIMIRVRQALLFPILFILLALLVSTPVLARDPDDHAHDLKVYFFYSPACGRCAQEEVYLETLKGEMPCLRVEELNVEDSTNVELLRAVTQKLAVEVNSLPVTVVGRQVFSGYAGDEITGAGIRQAIWSCHLNDCEDVVFPLRYPDGAPSEPEGVCEEPTSSLLQVKLPFLGTIDFRDYSLPVFTILIAAADGFNPCAMWVLAFLIGLLLGVEDKKRRWILGVTFIAASALVYFLFLAAWLNLFLFLGLIVWVRLLIGLVAVSAGAAHLRDFWRNRQECKVTGGEKRQQVFGKLREVIRRQNLALALVGIILLAFAVNLVELICSAGLPAVYTQVLSLSQISSGSHYAYLFLYIIIFMLDDLLVFFIAMKTLHAVGLGTKYSRYSNLIGGTLILLIGLALLFKPGLLSFGG